MRVPAAERATHAYRTAFACQRMLLMIPNLRTHMCEGVAPISNGGQLRVQRSALTLNSVCYAKTHSPCIVIMGYAGSDADEVSPDDVAGGEGVQKCANSGVDSYCCIDGGGCDCASGTSTLRFQGTPSVITTIRVTSTSSSSISTTSSSSSSPSTTFNRSPQRPLAGAAFPRAHYLSRRLHRRPAAQYHNRPLRRIRR